MLPLGNSPAVACNRIQVLYFRTLPSSFALVKDSTLLFSCNSALFGKNTRGGGKGGRFVAIFATNRICSSPFQG